MSVLAGTERLRGACAGAAPVRFGRVRAMRGLTLEAVGLDVAIGDLVRVEDGGGSVPAEVVALDGRRARCMPLSSMEGLRAGAQVRSTGGPMMIDVGPGLLGRVVGADGVPIDGLGTLGSTQRVPVTMGAPAALDRQRITQPLDTGVRVLDTLTTIGRGQRIGLFAGSGVGKSSLLSMVCRGCDAELSVIALVGERGREVRDFLEDDLGPEGLARSVVVVATSDEPPLLRLRAAETATRIAEFFRDGGADVVLMMDSLTRVAMAQREIGLSVGEPPATRGYPPSTFGLMAQLLERAGTAERGSVTGIYTVLVEGDDHNEPIADSARSVLDGHVVLDRDLAIRGHYPSVDAVASVSRVASRVTTPRQRALATALRSVLAARRQAQDLLDVGAYVPGSNALVDASVAHGEQIDAFLRQPIGEVSRASSSWEALSRLVEDLGVLP
ncbi:MAG: FliI/YscN family ATPase [Actinomyces sp.]|jgi:flagellum-specific ATP synthase|nr:FliI/YscN family ATPase [Actinomyces sp.]MCI1641410.1 FliI/YscN family ATPase [Actinomyces sp.]MCI1662300.1 FliI/YscN family ATPase [Actinomyces sp.]MCI1691762.1 FliI/YscN family ATPase [Actinomyces sp.]MCI1787446.1 FliI/YscN family ATPase [Actinomyces sp.]MCI1830921.1 FliI/YscN family ATPase [Actinomyces sp.]